MSLKCSCMSVAIIAETHVRIVHWRRGNSYNQSTSLYRKRSLCQQNPFSLYAWFCVLQQAFFVLEKHPRPFRGLHYAPMLRPLEQRQRRLNRGRIRRKKRCRTGCSKRPTRNGSRTSRTTQINCFSLPPS